MRPLTSGPAATSAVVNGPGGAGRGAVASKADSLVIPSVTLPDFVLGQAGRRGDKRALVDATTGPTLTYRELAIDVRRVGAGLAAHGVQPGDVVALCAPNSIEFVVAWYAASTVGATLTTLNPAFRGEEITQLLREARACWLVTSVELFEEKVRFCAVAAGVRQTFVLGAADRSPMGAIPFDSLYPEIDADVSAVRVGPADIAFLPWSSGTSGLPKSVVLTHRNLVASLCQTRPVHQVGEDDVVIAALPLFHAFGFQVTLNLALLQGATVVILPRFELDAFLRTVQDHAVTRAEIVPPIVLALATSDRVDEFDLSSLRVVTAGAAPLDGDLARTFAARIGCRLKQGYGMTELGGSSHIAPDHGLDKPESIGPALPGVECRVIDNVTGAEVGPGEPGELLIRCAAVMDGYLGNPAATAAMIDADGWLHTGDVVTVDRDGWFRVTGRIKELIKYKGFQIAPAELEGVLLTHPAVGDAAVVRSPDEIASEVPKAFIVLRGSVSADELVGWIGERVAPYKRIRRVEFVDQIPKSPSGKILRRLLVEQEHVAQERARGHEGVMAR
jgi:acyl-CoA synthetase (AMP-forming)/AMP-acid ligase II